MMKRVYFFLIISMAFACYAKKSASKKMAEPQSVNVVEKKRTLPAGTQVVDRIEAVLFGTEGTEIITQSDIERIGLDGKKHTKKDVLVERLMFMDALRSRIVVDEKTIDDYIAKLLKSMNATMDDLKKMFSQAGYTIEEGRRQMGILYGAQEMVRHKVQSKLYVTEQEIEAYCAEHPETISASYFLERAFVPIKQDDVEKTRDRVERFVKTGKGVTVSWSALPALAEDQIADEKQFITQLKPGQMHMQEIEGGFELLKLREKTASYERPIKERRKKVIAILQAPRLQQLIDEYTQTLLSSDAVASILDLDKSF